MAFETLTFQKPEASLYGFLRPGAFCSLTQVYGSETLTILHADIKQLEAISYEMSAKNPQSAVVGQFRSNVSPSFGHEAYLEKFKLYG